MLDVMWSSPDQPVFLKFNTSETSQIFGNICYEAKQRIKANRWNESLKIIEERRKYCPVIYYAYIKSACYFSSPHDLLCPKPGAFFPFRSHIRIFPE